MNKNTPSLICRMCLKIFTKHENSVSVLQITDFLSSCTTIKVLENDRLPSSICNNCYGRANQAYTFKLLCEASDQQLQKRLKEVSEFSDGKTNPVLSHDVNFEPKLKEELNTEEKAVDAGNKLFACRFCNANFAHHMQLIKHEVEHQNGSKCYICGKDFPSAKQLANHVNMHNRKGAHLCQTCGKQFTLPENLVRHQRIHNGIRPYKCKICNRSFIQSNELKSHMITHSSEKSHLCNVCGNKYARRVSLQIHMRRLHSDLSALRPYQCDICGSSFKDKKDLSQHISIHKNERKHICKVCNKAFNKGFNLKVHERIHSGYKPFVCHICQKAFIQKHVLNKHMQTHPGIS